MLDPGRPEGLSRVHTGTTLTLEFSVNWEGKTESFQTQEDSTFVPPCSLGRRKTCSQGWGSLGSTPPHTHGQNDRIRTGDRWRAAGAAPQRSNGKAREGSWACRPQHQDDHWTQRNDTGGESRGSHGWRQAAEGKGVHWTWALGPAPEGGAPQSTRGLRAEPQEHPRDGAAYPPSPCGAGLHTQHKG